MKRAIAATIIICAAAGTARAGGFALAEQSATAGGTAGAGTATPRRSPTAAAGGSDWACLPRAPP